MAGLVKKSRKREARRRQRPLPDAAVSKMAARTPGSRIDRRYDLLVVLAGALARCQVTVYAGSRCSRFHPSARSNTANGARAEEQRSKESEPAHAPSRSAGAHLGSAMRWAEII